MRAESDVMPARAFKIDKRGFLADITFFENVTEVQKEEAAAYEYDTYTYTVPHREDLEEAIALNYAVWLAAAKDNEIDKIAPPTVEVRIESLESAVTDLIVQSFEF